MTPNDEDTLRHSRVDRVHVSGQMVGVECFADCVRTRGFPTSAPAFETSLLPYALAEREPSASMTNTLFRLTPSTYGIGIL